MCCVLGYYNGSRCQLYTYTPEYSLVKSQKEISPFDPPPLDGTVVVLHTLNIMIITFCSYARILEDFFQCSYTSVAYVWKTINHQNDNCD